jgi:hypothetical protein
MYLLASSAANFIPHHMAFPIPHVLVTEIANYTKAGIAAYGVQRFSAGRLGLDRLRSMRDFVGARPERSVISVRLNCGRPIAGSDLAHVHALGPDRITVKLLN